MSGLEINKKVIFSQESPPVNVCEEGVNLGYSMHEMIWGKALHILEIPDNFLDTNGTKSLGKNGQPSNVNIDYGNSIVNRAEDPVLIYTFSTVIPYIREDSSISSQVKRISNFINFIGINTNNLDSTSNDSPQLLGEVFKKGGAVCRHKSLMFKIICDEVGIENGIRGGFIINNGNYIRHIWNEVKIEGEWYVIDNAYQKEKGNFKYNDSQEKYYIREGNLFVSLEEVGEGNLSK